MTSSRLALAVVALAAVLAAPGAAMAAAMIRSADIVDGEVKTRDLARSAVTSSRVANDTLAGRDIKESSLGPVPDAARVGGLRVENVFLDTQDNEDGVLLTMSGLRVRYLCIGSADLFVYARVLPSSGGTVFYEGYRGFSYGVLAAGEEAEIASGQAGNGGMGRVQYFDPDGHVVTFEWTIDARESCRFVGTAIGG